MSTTYHEEGLSAPARELHRALASLIEELEAIDWYSQRMDVTEDPDLKEILKHNRDEEIEHAAMTLEWLRRRLPRLDEELGTYLFVSGSSVEAEKSEKGGGRGGDLGLGDS